MLFTFQQRAIFANYIAAVLEISLVREKKEGTKVKLLFITTEQEN